jgi:hypothetical protein
VLWADLPDCERNLHETELLLARVFVLTGKCV